MAGIYIHVPFCSSFCIYCDFYSEINKGGIKGWRSSLLQEINHQKDFFRRGVLPETLYFGGGTPSLLDISDIQTITSQLQSAFGVETFEEFTIEVNPDDICRADAELILAYKELGINRISMGVQSFSDDHLKWMRRRHNSAGAKEAFQKLRDGGFENISIDLIFGFASLTSDVWEDTIDQAILLRPNHISCYQMTLEEGSDLFALTKNGQYVEPSQEEMAHQYSLLQRRLSEAGYLQYEISNFSLPGFESKHNSSYWARVPYLGLGPAAHSFDGEKLRRWNTPNIEQYNSAIERGESYSGYEQLSDIDVFNEQLMLGLRRVKGLSLKSLNSQFLEQIKPALTKMVKAGNINLENDIIYIPTNKMFVSDGIIESLFIEQEE